MCVKVKTIKNNNNNSNKITIPKSSILYKKLVTVTKNCIARLLKKTF